MQIRRVIPHLGWDRGEENQGMREYITPYPLDLKVERRVVILTDRMNEESRESEGSVTCVSVTISQKLFHLISDMEE